MNRRQIIINLGLAVAAGTLRVQRARPAMFAPWSWSRSPSITVIAAEADKRIPVVQQAVDFWNQTFADLKSPFRLGAVTVVSGSVPDADMQALSDQVLHEIGQPTLPASITRYRGDLLVVLSNANFISFTARHGQRVVVGIKGTDFPPLTLPNVLQNVIAHELGHALGLGHNRDPALLMCGRPASCRPDAFQSATDHFFPLSSAERSRLLFLYPAK